MQGVTYVSFWCSCASLTTELIVNLHIGVSSDHVITFEHHLLFIVTDALRVVFKRHILVFMMMSRRQLGCLILVAYSYIQMIDVLRQPLYT